MFHIFYVIIFHYKNILQKLHIYITFESGISN